MEVYQEVVEEACRSYENAYGEKDFGGMLLGVHLMKAAYGATDSVEETIKSLKLTGLKEALCLDFKGLDNTDEKFYIYVHPTKALVGVFDTFNKFKKDNNLNGGKLYGAMLKPPEGHPFHNLHVSRSGSENGHIIFDFDIRNVGYWFKYFFEHIDELDNDFSYLDHVFIWLLHYMDTKDANGKDLGVGNYNYNEINRSRIAACTEWAKKQLETIKYGHDAS